MPDPENKYPPPPEPTGIPLDYPIYEKEMAAMAAQQEAGTMAAIGSIVDHRPTVSEQLYMRKKHLEHELAYVNAAIEAALREPGTMAVLDGISKVGLLR